MPLPSVSGWIIDYRTASQIFLSLSNARISHCLAKCQSGDLHVCHHEESKFRADPIVCAPFVNDQCRIFEPDEDVYAICPALQTAPTGKPFLSGTSEVSIFITAIAISRGFGVISECLTRN